MIFSFRGRVQKKVCLEVQTSTVREITEVVQHDKKDERGKNNEMETESVIHVNSGGMLNISNCTIYSHCTIHKK